MKPYYIRWCDATSREQAWSTFEDSINWADNENWEVESLGWILKETKEYILLCTKKTPENNETEPQYGSLFKIPKTWIRERKRCQITNRPAVRKLIKKEL